VGAVPRVSVIMNCLNGENYLREAIDSVLAQTFTDWEIVFWDNGSKDASRDIARSYGDKVRCFGGGSTVALGEARNHALSGARGELIAFLDCDDTWLPGKLAKQVELMDARRDADFVYSNYESWHVASNRRVPALRGVQPEGRVFDAFLKRYPVGLLTVLLRRSRLERLDELFDPRFQLVEELDLFLRLLFDARAAYLPDVLAVYRIHADMASYALRDNWFSEHMQVLEKLRRLDREGRHAHALRDFEIRLNLFPAKIQIARGSLKDARKYLSAHKLHSAQFLLLYAVTFLPVRLWMAMRPLWGRGVVFR
jgi:glycosyltransferase involved in cell wall biosynthesis